MLELAIRLHPNVLPYQVKVCGLPMVLGKN